MAKVVKLNFRAPIPEGYFPKLDSSVATRSWPPRADGTTLQNIARESDRIKIDVSQLENWSKKIEDAISNSNIKSKLSL